MITIMRLTLLAGLCHLACSYPLHVLTSSSSSSVSSMVGAEHEREVDPRHRVESVGVPARARGLWPVDGVLHSPKQKKLVVFYNGWRLLDNCDPSNWGRT